MSQAILVVNAGSSSLKFSLYRHDGAGDLTLSCKGQVEGIGTEAPHFVAADASGRTLDERRRWDAGSAMDVDAFFLFLRPWIEDHLGGDRLIAAGHRVVHGGTAFTAPALVDDAVLEALEALNPLAPLHQPHNVAAIRALRQAHPELPQVACFDTAFHATQPPVATRFALPRELTEAGVRRYGFHGISYEYIA
ncbi:MAG TPA: acetate kinase, partial [Stellaceae bacterium]